MPSRSTAYRECTSGSAIPKSVSASASKGASTMNIVFAVLLLGGVSIQDKPQEIAKKDLPKQAVCDVCASKGIHMGLEKPAAGIMYKGRAYFLCNSKEVAEFMKDPEAFVPPVLPRPAPTVSFKNLSGESI